MRYTQLTPGPYESRTFSFDTGELLIAMEHCKQSVQAELTLPPNRFAFGTLGRSQDPSSRIFGDEVSSNTVYVERASGWTDAIVQQNTLQLLVSVDSQSLLTSEAIIPEVSEWLLCNGPRGSIVESKYFADTLRSNIWSAIGFATHAKTSQELDILSQSIIFSIGSALTIAWIRQHGLSDCSRTTHFERFYEARKLLLSSLPNSSATQLTSDVLKPLRNLGSKRSIEQAFTANISMGPLSYLRVMRLHNARRKLLQPDRLTQNIGDIAAEEGFWDKSKSRCSIRNTSANDRQIHATASSISGQSFDTKPQEKANGRKQHTAIKQQGHRETRPPNPLSDRTPRVPLTKLDRHKLLVQHLAVIQATRRIHARRTQTSLAFRPTQRPQGH